MFSKHWRPVAAAFMVVLGALSLGASPAAAGPNGQTCIRSRMTYDDAGVTKPAAFWLVRILGVPSSGAAVEVGLVETAADGWFTACFSDAAAPDWPTGGQKIRLSYEARNALVRVVVPVTDAASQQQVAIEVDYAPITAPGTTASPVQLTPKAIAKTGANAHPLWAAAKTWATIIKTYQWVHSDATKVCWDVNEAPGQPCQVYTVKWFNNAALWVPSTATSHYFGDPQNPDQTITTGRQIRLAPADAENDSVVAHELGHYLMHDSYGFFPLGGPELPLCILRYHYFEHQIGYPDLLPVPASQVYAAQRCAFVEAFADWVSMMVRQTPTFPGGLNLESPPSTWDQGDMVEGRLAGALLDLSDTTNDGCEAYSDTSIAPTIGPWEPGYTWTTALLLKPTTWPEYVAARATLGQPVPATVQRRNTLATPFC